MGNVPLTTAATTSLSLRGQGKLSASAISAYLKSPRSYYYSYIRMLEPPYGLSPDLIFGQHWASFVDRFYKGEPWETNTQQLKISLDNDLQTMSNARMNYLGIGLALAQDYYEQFRPDDGARTPEQSEMYVENDMFFGYLDGLSAAKVIHESKSTSRAVSGKKHRLSEQLWQWHNSTQVKLYAVLAEATGVRMEFAWKDQPNVTYRAPVHLITKEQRQRWEKQLRVLGGHILSLGDDIENYPCHPTGCCLISKNYVSPCGFQALCDDVPYAEQMYTRRKELR